MNRAPTVLNLFFSALSAYSAVKILFCFVEIEGCGIDAIAQPGRARTIVKQVSQMGPAPAANHFRPNHEMALVGFGSHVFFRYGLIKAWPTGTGFEFCIRREQIISTSSTTVNAFFMIVPVLSCECPFRPLFSSNVILLGGELLFPFLFGFLNFIRHDVPLLLSRKNFDLICGRRLLSLLRTRKIDPEHGSRYQK